MALFCFPVKWVGAGAGEEGEIQHLDWSPFLLTPEDKAAGAWAGALLGGQAWHRGVLSLREVLHSRL